METSHNRSKTGKIIIDTNFLLIPASFRVDILSGIEKTVNFKYEIIILDKSLEELKNIVLKPKRAVKGADRDAAKLALALVDANRGKLNILPSKGHVDDSIVELAAGEKDKGLVLVATQDQGLKRRLRKIGVRRIVLKKKKYLMIEE